MLRLLSAASSGPKSQNNHPSTLKDTRIILETTARRRKVKIRDDTTKFSEHDHQNLTPRSSIGPDEHASRLNKRN